MSEREFIEKMIDIMDTDYELQMESVLEDIEEWDSLSNVSFLAMCSKEAKSHVEPHEVRDAVTVRDLFNLVIR